MSSKIYVQATLIGWLKEDSIIKEVGTGYAVCKFTVKALKYNRHTKEKDTVFIDCDLWGKKAEKMRPMLRAGKYVQVFGTIDSFKHVSITVSDITLLSQAEGQKKKDEMPPPHPTQDAQEPTSEELKELF